MRIKSVILYNKDMLRKRIVNFNIKGITIISGKEKTGKTALQEIVRYCLGSKKCNVPEGIIKDNVSWYGLHLLFDNDEVFIARKNPNKSQQTTGEAYFQIGSELQIPDSMKYVKSVNIEGVVEILNRKLGIVENLNIPEEGSTRLELEANIKHTLFYCFQDQNDIGTKNYLFHKQSEEYIPQAMRDTLPFLLGAIPQEKIYIENEYKQLKREINIIKRKIKEIEAIDGENNSTAHKLYVQAINLGMIESQGESPLNYYETLKKIMNWEEEEIEEVNSSEIHDLQYKLEVLEKQKRSINEKIASVKRFKNNMESFKNEIEVHQSRLESIKAFEKLSKFENAFGDELNRIIPSYSYIKDAYSEMDSKLTKLNNEDMNLIEYYNGQIQNKEEIETQIDIVKSEIDAIYDQDEETRRVKELNVRRGIIIGKILLWLESVDFLYSDDKIVRDLKIKEIELEKIDNLLDEMDEQESLESIINLLNEKLTELSRDLQLEHSSNPIRFDLRRLTIVADRIDKSITLQQMGGAANWVGYHLAIHLALHDIFIQRLSPVPRFIFFDQPSIAYFPDHAFEMTEKQKERIFIEKEEPIKKIYDFIFKSVEKMKIKPQIIITDHALLNDDKFQEALIENWRDGNINEALIPKQWYR